MAHAIKVDSPFVTAEETADILGIPRSRANTLIERARQIASRVLHGDSRNGEFATAARGTRKAGRGKTSRPNGGTKAYRSKSRKASAKR